MDDQMQSRTFFSQTFSTEPQEPLMFLDVPSLVGVVFTFSPQSQKYYILGSTLGFSSGLAWALCDYILNFDTLPLSDFSFLFLIRCQSCSSWVIIFFRMLLLTVFTCSSAFLMISCTLLLSVLLKYTCAQCSFFLVSRSALKQSSSVFWSTVLPVAKCICSTMCFLSISEWILRLKQSYRLSAALSRTQTANQMKQDIPYRAEQAWKSHQWQACGDNDHLPQQSRALRSHKRNQDNQPRAQSDLISTDLQSFVLKGCGSLGVDHHDAKSYYNLPLISCIRYNQISMDDLDVYLRDQEKQLDAYEEASLMRVSSVVRSLVQQEECELNYQEFLHLQIRIDANRQRILKCNLAITQLIAIINPIHQSLLQKQQQVSPLKEGSAQQRRAAWFQSIQATLQTFKKVLTIRQVQLTMIFFILQYRNKANFKELYSKNFGEIMEFMIPEEDCHRKINIFILDDLFKKEQEYLNTYFQMIGRLKHLQDYLEGEERREDIEEEIEKIINSLKIANSKMKTISEIFPFACIKDVNDLFSFNQLHERWQILLKKQIITYIYLSDKLTLQKSFKEIKQNLNVINAAMSIMDRQKWQTDHSLNKKMKIFYENSIKILKCAVNKKQAKFEAQVMISEGKDELAKEIWNLPENKKFREFIQLCLPSINHSVVYYLPRVYKDYFQQRYQLKQKAILPQILIKEHSQYRQQLLVKKPYQQSIRIRINASKKLQARDPQQKQKGGFFGSVTKLFKSDDKVPKAVIFHIHGGGFISMSSFIHQTYTRIWANNLNVPIVSVDYGKAPDRPFPQGLYDCLEAYLWTVYTFAQIYEVQPEKIILVGDSAGGNLVAALTTLLIQWKLPKPTGIVLVYPALNLNLLNYTPSLLTALSDMILPHTFLKVCAKSYLGKHQADSDKDPFISPIFTSDEILTQYPTTQIFVGNKDPFHDDCCRFIERLSQLNTKECHLSILDQFPHGFLQFDLKLMPNQYTRQATKLVQKALHKLLH